MQNHQRLYKFLSEYVIKKRTPIKREIKYHYNVTN